MSLLKSLFGSKESPITTNEEFWEWFSTHAEEFYKQVKKGNADSGFFSKLAPKLNELREGYWFLAGMADDETAEVILTADGVIKNIPFVEDLIASAPDIKGWKLTALKAPLDIKEVSIRMEDLVFGEETLFFYSNDDPNHPDEIDITIVYPNYQESNKDMVTNGVYIFLDNYLGELNSVTQIDNVQIVPQAEEGKELVPISKLKDFVLWREKEFVEKYEGTRHDTANDNYGTLEGRFPDGQLMLAVINSTLLQWDAKASHPWILCIDITYKGNKNGMPDDQTYSLLNEFEDSVMQELKDSDGYLNIGRETAKGMRTIYFACREFRKPAKVVEKLLIAYKGKLNVMYDMYKDKYWQSLNRFNKH